MDDAALWRRGAYVRPIDPFSNTLYSLYQLYITSKELDVAIETTSRYMNLGNTTSVDDSLMLVVVIGESYIKHHSNLYGYSLNTCPNLSREQEEGSLFVFHDVITPYIGTSRVIRNVLSCNNHNGGERWCDAPYFPAIFKNVGYDVYMWDNQKGDNPNSTYAFTLNSFMYNKRLEKISYSQMNDICFKYDGDLISSFPKNINSPSLVIFHLVGQHFNAAVRYPHEDEFNHFSVDSVKRDEKWMTTTKRQAIADYDNATYYNDYVMSTILDMFRNKKAVAVYFSDHGEEIYDYRDSQGRVDCDSGSPQVLRYQYEIPFFIWCSPKFLSAEPEIVRSIANSVNRPFMIDNLCQVLFHIAKMQVPAYSAELDMLSDKYKSVGRIVGLGVNYDEIMN